MLAEIDAFQQWLRRRSPHASTHLHYSNDLKLFFAWSGLPVEAITPGTIDRYITHCQSEGHAVATINRRLASLSRFYNYLALMHDDAPTNPVLYRRHSIRQGQHLPRDVEDQVVAALFAVIEDVHFDSAQCKRDRAMFLLMVRCGLRVGEVRNLNLSDCYLQPAPGQLPRLWLHGKGGGERVAYLSPQALSALSAWLKVRPVTVEPALFLNRFGHRFSVTGIQLNLAHYCQLAGVWFTCHQLRHTFARHLVEAGVPVTTIQRLLGHARLRTTELYLHVANTQVQADYQAAMTALSERLKLEGGVA
jgi:site-specific recombinase XerD